MSALLWVDGFFAELRDSLAGGLREEAHRLSFTLGFAAEPGVPWSAVFSNEITLAAPALFAEAMPSAPESAVRHALCAHALAVVEAMGRDRIEDRQVHATPAMERVLAAVRTMRNERLALLGGGPAAARIAEGADRELSDAIDLERDLIDGGLAVDFGTYGAVSERKQSPGLVATTILAERAGWEDGLREVARRALLDAALGLQIYDDVLDWETDATRGGAWALSLARSTLRAGPRGFGTTPAEQRAEVHASGVLARMLRRARYHFRSAARRAAALGAARVSAWAEERARALEDLAVRESRHAGYVNRAHTLAAWARAVFVTKA